MTDTNVLAALSHPLRRRLMDVLQVDGPGTVTMLAGRTTERVPNISHHVRVLAQSGLIVEVPELARDRRERWWRLRASAVRWAGADLGVEPEAVAVVPTARTLDAEGCTEKVERWYHVDGCRRERCETSAFSTERWLRLTPAELADLSQEVVDLLRRWSSRGEPDDAERESVLVFAYGVPARP